MGPRLALRSENMHPELINLLPEDRIRTFRRAYFLRLSALTVLLLAFLVGAHAFFLLPTHELIRAQILSHQPALAEIRSAKDNADQALYEASLAALAKSAERIKMIGASRSIIATVTQVLDVPRANVLLSGVAYAPPSGAKNAATVSLTGVAKTRDDLRQYQVALQSLPLVASADVPVTAYSQGTNIPFTIGVTLTAP